jgi:hypothetical protein
MEMGNEEGRLGLGLRLGLRGVGLMGAMSNSMSWIASSRTKNVDTFWIAEAVGR